MVKIVEVLDDYQLNKNSIRRIKNFKEDTKVIVTFNDDEVKRILNDVKEETYSNLRDKLILILLFDSGVKVSELCDIKINDIARKHILIHGKGSKQQLVYISNRLELNLSDMPLFSFRLPAFSSFQ